MKTSSNVSAVLDTRAANAILLGTTGLEMHRASSRDDWSRVRALRYDALRARDDIPESATHAFGDAHDDALHTTTFLLSRQGRPLGTTRLSVCTASRRWELPASAAFGHEIETAIGLDSTIVEASLTAVRPDTTQDPKDVLFHLFKAHMLRCALENADWLVTAVRESQIGFYRRMFNMEILSGAEPCCGLAQPRVLMGMEYREQAPLLFKRIPVLAVTPADEAKYESTGGVGFPVERRGALRQQAA
jgi:hypothetical protein